MTPAEARFLVEVQRKLRDLDPWTRGHFAECLVAEIIGASLAAHTVSPHDLEWDIRSPAITIAVRATGGYSLGRDRNRQPAPGNWSFPEAKWAWDGASDDWVRDRDGNPLTRRLHADVAVLCHHHGFDITTNWTFHVLPQQALETWPTKTLSPNALTSSGYPPISEDQLASAIRDAVA